MLARQTDGHSAPLGRQPACSGLRAAPPTRICAPVLSQQPLDVTRAHPARVYDYLLGGKDNYAPDREAAQQLLAVAPTAHLAARANRACMHRMTRVLAQAGIRQWLDVGTGIPTRPNLHEVAQEVAPEAHVVYVDNDPMVLAHAQALLTSSPRGRTAYLPADVTDPDTILQAPALHDAVDVDRPVALSLLALLHFVPDEHDPYGIVRRLLDALPSGSALALTHATGDFLDRRAAERAAAIYRAGGTALRLRSRAEVARFFTGLDLVQPGIVMAHRWLPDQAVGQPSRRPHEWAHALSDAKVSLWAAVAFKP